jgi:WD40 repeat protein
MSFMPVALTWDEAGRWVASGGGYAEPADAKIFLWDLEAGEVEECATFSGRCLPRSIVLDAGDGLGISGLEFLNGGDLLAAGAAGLRRWSVESATFEQLFDEPVVDLSLLPDKRSALLSVGERGSEARRIVAFDLIEETEREIDLSRFGDRVTDCTVDPTGEILVCGDREGAVRIGRWDDGRPHLLLGHAGSIQSVAISPDGRWIATGSADRDIRLWPMPDLSEPPFQTLPYDELLAKLRSLTNLRVVEDPASETGWSLEIGPFPGWATAPTW